MIIAGKWESGGALIKELLNFATPPNNEIRLRMTLLIIKFLY